jgi:hypothetical protein
MARSVSKEVLSRVIAAAGQLSEMSTSMPSVISKPWRYGAKTARSSSTVPETEVAHLTSGCVPWLTSSCRSGEATLMMSLPAVFDW